MGPMIGSAAGDPKTAVIFLDGVGHYQQALSARGTLRAGPTSGTCRRWEYAITRGAGACGAVSTGIVRSGSPSARISRSLRARPGSIATAVPMKWAV